LSVGAVQSIEQIEGEQFTRQRSCVLNDEHSVSGYRSDMVGLHGVFAAALKRDAGVTLLAERRLPNLRSFATTVPETYFGWPLNLASEPDRASR